MDLFCNINCLTDINKGHVFYRYLNEETYMNNLISFISTGIENKQYILVVENLRNYSKLMGIIATHFSEEQQLTIKVVNNFNYYLSKGDFNTQNIVSHFTKDISFINKLNTTIRTWAHVEWASSEGDAKLLKDFETTADELVMEENLLSVCAYSSMRLTPQLCTTLEMVHQYIMTDDQFSSSPTYQNRL